MAKSMAVPQKNKDSITVQSPTATSGYLPKRTESRDSKRSVYIEAVKLADTEGRAAAARGRGGGGRS